MAVLLRRVRKRHLCLSSSSRLLPAKFNAFRDQRSSTKVVGVKLSRILLACITALGTATAHSGN